MLQVRPLRGPGGEWGAHGVIDIEQDADHVFQFMRQIEEQPKWNAGVKESHVVSQLDRRTSVVKQVLRWNFLALRGDFNLNLAITEEPGTRTITTRMLQGSMLRHFSSTVGVQRLGPKSCRLEMQLLLQPKIYVPLGVRHMVGGQVRKQLHGVLEKVKQTMDSQELQRQPRRLQWPAAPFGRLQLPMLQLPMLLHTKPARSASSTSSSSSLAAASSSASSTTSTTSTTGSLQLPPQLEGMLQGLLQLQPLSLAGAW